MRLRRAKLLLLAGALVAPFLASASAMLPRYVDTKLADSYLLRSPYFKAYDSRTGYYLWVEHEFDGASNTIFIAPDPGLFHRPKYQREDYRRMSFPLVTGRGIRVGDSVKRLYRALGRPSTTQHLKILGEKRRVDIYKHYNNKSGGQRREYEAVYVSRKGRIQGIRFSYYRGTW